MSKSKYSSKRSKNQSGLGKFLSSPLGLVLAGIALVAGALFALWKSSQPAASNASVEVSGSPSLKVDQELVDLGDVPLNQTVSVSFQLTNVGDQALRFTEQPYIEVVEGC
ncbi:MAG TPA: hypothetical protein VLA49_19380 [Anaerolineales bacterium]|nr:hypothetical protein [Anaerolineales bacterium]